ncbi:DNA double-strand break repair nuclease NurA [Neofamilia massiliensis]|uniref:DNA double-strand break repair nuclease NurA n=1 Tax=Neofamilia massiliensis TaxID=1673724 RepID=UPI00138E426F|nr:DNA double-strand break repair nuclease NurA [Neofamilia massiliensis]
MKELNNKLGYDLSNIKNFNRDYLRDQLKCYGSFINLRKLERDELEKFSKMACIDGSVNRFGSSHPHYIDVYQGLAKVSKSSLADVILSDVYSPLTSNLSDDEEDLKKKLLARIEILTGLETLKTYDLDYLLMDGNLIRYTIEDKENFDKLIGLCLEKNVLLAGFIKEPKTNILGELIFKDSQEIKLYDKDILYGILNEGEGYILDDSYNKKVDQGFSSMFLRMASYPGVTGLEVLEGQRANLYNIANLCYSLTPQMSRGVPLIIDMVDKEVKIDDKLMREIVLAYLDSDLVERFFRSERSMRR